MSIYLIQYKESDSYIFESRVKTIGEWVKYFSNNFLVKSNLNSQEIYNKLIEGHDEKSILIIEVSNSNYYGRMNTSVWEFLKNKK